jgi:hypothetical protein
MSVHKPFLYIHIPKAGGRTIQHSQIIDLKWEGHKFAKDYNLNIVYSFTFLRNPYERMFSAWNYCMYNNDTTGTAVKNKIRKQYNTFEHFIKNIQESKQIQPLLFTYTMCDFICDKDGNVIIDYVGDITKMESQFYEIQTINPYHKETLQFPEKRVNVTEHDDWRLHYTPEIADIVYQHWKVDFDKFDYDKDSYIK